MIVYSNQPATSVPFDNTTNGFTAATVQAAIEEAKAAAGGGGGGGTTNNGMGARKIPSGQTYTIDTNYESVVTDRIFCYGRLALKGRLTIIR